MLEHNSEDINNLFSESVESIDETVFRRKTRKEKRKRKIAKKKLTRIGKYKALGRVVKKGKGRYKRLVIKGPKGKKVTVRLRRVSAKEKQKRKRIGRELGRRFGGKKS